MDLITKARLRHYLPPPKSQVDKDLEAVRAREILEGGGAAPIQDIDNPGYSKKEVKSAAKRVIKLKKKVADVPVEEL
jgi:hypothetical protein